MDISQERIYTKRNFFSARMKKEGVVRIRTATKLILAIISIVLLFGTPFIALFSENAHAYTISNTISNSISNNANINANKTNFDAKVHADFSDYETFQRTQYGMNEKDRWSKFTYDDTYHKLHKSLNTSYIRVWIDKAQPNPKVGVWDFKTLDDYVNSVYSSGAQPFMSISYAPAHLSKNGYGNELNYPNDRTAFAKYCAEIVRHYNIEQKRGIEYWEIWNEPWWESQSMNEYILIFNEAAKAMKSVDPTIKVGGPGNAWYIPEWVDATLQNCPELDFIPWHIYNGDRSGNADWQILDDTTIYEQTAKDARARIEKSRPNSNIEIMVTELNSVSKWNPTTDPRISYQFNAAWYASALNHLIRGGIDKEFYFEGTCSDDPYHNFGMWSDTGKIKPTYWTKMLFSKYAPYGSTVVNSTSTNHKIESLAIINETSNLFLINKENKTMHTFVDISGLNLTNLTQNLTQNQKQNQTQVKNATLYIFSESTFDKFNTNASNPIQKNTITLQNGTFEINLPAYSIAVLVIESLPDVLNIEAEEFAFKNITAFSSVTSSDTKPAYINTNTSPNFCSLEINESISNLANYGKGTKKITIKASNGDGLAQNVTSQNGTSQISQDAQDENVTNVVNITDITNGTNITNTSPLTPKPITPTPLTQPRMLVKINGTQIGETNVSEDWANYTFSANLTGNDVIEISCADSDNISTENHTSEKRIIIDWVSIENPKQPENQTDDTNSTIEDKDTENNITTNNTALPEPSSEENNPKNVTHDTQKENASEGTGLSILVPVIKVAEPSENKTEPYIRPATVTAANLTNLDMANGSIEIGVSEIALTEKGTLEKRTITTTVPTITLDAWNREPGLMAIAFEFAVYYTSALSTCILLLTRRMSLFSIF